ncbi:MAG: hypothetical protein IPG50_34460 [Myxococcales bacterium]|nr:hypothetical protein [Myxococcales bacterium]
MARLIQKVNAGRFTDLFATRKKAGEIASHVYGTSRTLVVGPAPSPLYPSISPDFRTIGEAMAFIPLPGKTNAGEVILAAPQDTWTILVLPGVYHEEIKMKPNVILVGIGQSAVIFPPANWVSPEGPGGRRAVVYLNHNNSVQNLVFGKLGMTSTDYVFWNRDCYDIGDRMEGVDTNRRAIAPSGIGITDVWVWPYPVAPGAAETSTLGKTLLMEGDWHTALFTNFGSSYWETSGYDVELRGGGSDAAKATAKDCHFTNCFFDALFIDSFSDGAFLVDNCIDVHLRNSLVRTTPSPAWRKAHQTEPAPGACVKVRANGHLWLESSHLEAPGTNSYRLLDVDDESVCFFRASSTDSVLGENNVRWPAWPRPPALAPVPSGFGWPSPSRPFGYGP